MVTNTVILRQRKPCQVANFMLKNSISELKWNFIEFSMQNETNVCDFIVISCNPEFSTSNLNDLKENAKTICKEALTC